MDIMKSMASGLLAQRLGLPVYSSIQTTVELNRGTSLKCQASDTNHHSQGTM